MTTIRSANIISRELCRYRHSFPPVCLNTVRWIEVNEETGRYVGWCDEHVPEGEQDPEREDGAQWKVTS